MLRFPCSAVCRLLLCGLMLPLSLLAQELREQPIPFSVWLDLRSLARPSAPSIALPIWLETFQSEHFPARDAAPEHTALRLRLRRMAHLNDEIELRVFFQDEAEARPVVTGWTETGLLLYQSDPLGCGIGLPSSEKLTVAVDGIDYLEITVPGDGQNISGIFLTTLRKTETRFAFDFPNQPTSDAFGDLPPSRPDAFDGLLFGRVKATLELGVTKLSSDSGERETVFLIELDRQPLIAIVSFEVLHADIAEPPALSVNGRPLGPAHLFLPDLADPAYRGEARPMEADMRFRYAGWLRCQKVIPGSALRAGLNRLVLGVNRNAGSVAVRNVEVQLKHNWQNLDYTLTP